MGSKIFGIGFPKTGTTSMEEAMLILGYRVCRGGWRNPVTNLLAAFALNKDYPRIDRIISQYDAFFDMPFGGGNLWRYLDETYPDGKFILTIREPEAWYRSLVAEMSKLSKSEDDDHMAIMFAHSRMAFVFFLEEVFGITDLIAEKDRIIAGYERYNAEILEHFKSDERMLVIDLAEETQWEKICNFVGAEVPDKPFPHKNRSADHAAKRKAAQGQKAPAPQPPQPELSAPGTTTGVSASLKQRLSRFLSNRQS